MVRNKSLKDKIELELNEKVKEYYNSQDISELKENEKYIILISVNNLLHAISESKDKKRIDTMTKGNSSLLNSVCEFYKYKKIKINYFYLISINNKKFYIDLLKNKEFVKLVNKKRG